MPEPVQASDLADLDGLDDWRYLTGAIEATFALRSSGDARRFSAAAEFVRLIAAASDDANHHPDLRLNYPGIVHVRLTTHAIGGLSELDLQLARVISGLAEDNGFESRSTDSPETEDRD